MVGYVLFGLFLVLMVVVGILSRRTIRNPDDFMIGGRRMGPWLTAFSYGTTYFSAVIFVGYAGRFGWDLGLSAVWIGIGNALVGSLLAWLVLGERTRRISGRLGVGTMPDYFRRRFDSPGLERLSAVIIFVFLVPYSASVYQGLGAILQVFFKETFLADPRAAMALMAVVTALYLVFGGYVSTAVNSLIQGIVMVAGVAYLVIRVLAAVGGLRQGIAALAEAGGPAMTSPVGPDPATLWILVAMTSFGTFGLPQMINKYSAIRDTASVRRGAAISFVFALIIGGGAYFMGAFGRVLAPVLGIPSDIAPDARMPAIFDALLSREMMAVLVLLMLSASMSTLASVVLASAPAVSRNLLRKEGIGWMRVLCLVFILFSYLVAVIPSAIVTLMAFSWGAVSGAFIGPFLWGLYSKTLTKAGATGGMIAGLSTVLVGAAAALLANPAAAPSWAPRLAVLAMVVSMVATPASGWLFRKRFPIPKGADAL